MIDLTLKFDKNKTFIDNPCCIMVFIKDFQDPLYVRSHVFIQFSFVPYLLTQNFNPIKFDTTYAKTS